MAEELRPEEEKTPAAAAETTPAAEEQEMEKRRLRKEQVGIVVSNRMEKSVVVRVERQVRHPLYQKTIRQSSKLMAHDEENKCRVGDRVLIRETRPISKRKSWRVISIVSSPQQ